MHKKAAEGIPPAALSVDAVNEAINDMDRSNVQMIIRGSFIGMMSYPNENGILTPIAQLVKGDLISVSLANIITRQQLDETLAAARAGAKKVRGKANQEKERKDAEDARRDFTYAVKIDREVKYLDTWYNNKSHLQGFNYTKQTNSPYLIPQNADLVLGHRNEDNQIEVFVFATGNIDPGEEVNIGEGAYHWNNERHEFTDGDNFEYTIVEDPNATAVVVDQGDDEEDENVADDDDGQH